MSMFEPATREQLNARIALTGPAGSGKTFTALTLATALSKTGRIALVDTELRANEYADRFRFDRAPVKVADPSKFPALALDAANTGHDVLILDSATHYWSGNGGALDIVDRTADKRRAWGDYRPVENDFMAALLTFPGHVIVTMRVKTNYVTEEQENGRQRVRRLGMKPDQRDTFDYEFSIIGDMDTDHTLTITKTTCPRLVDTTWNRPGAEFVEVLREWLGQGEPMPTALEYAERIAAADDAGLKAVWGELSRRAMLDAPALDEGTVTNLGQMIRRRVTAREAARKQGQQSNATALADAAASNGNGANA